MTDRELLELAARAAGIEPIDFSVCEEFGRGYLLADCIWWNPLTDDGDALRLAVKLGAEFVASHRAKMTEVAIEQVERAELWERHNDDPYAATRRAIVRAVAEVGKGVIPFPTVDEIKQFANVHD